MRNPLKRTQKHYDLVFSKTNTEYLSTVFGWSVEDHARLVKELMEVITDEKNQNLSKTESLELFLEQNKEKLELKTANDYLLLGIAFQRAIEKAKGKIEERLLRDMPPHLVGAILEQKLQETLGGLGKVEVINRTDTAGSDEGLPIRKAKAKRKVIN